MPKTTYTVNGSSTITNEALLVSTLQKVDKRLIDLTMKTRPLTDYLEKNKDTTHLVGGSQFEFPLIVSRNPNGGMIDYDEGLNMDSFDPFEKLVYQAKLAGFGVRWGLKEKAINRGDPMLFRIIDQIINLTEQSMRDTIQTQVINGNGAGKNIYGFETLCPATASASQTTTIGGLSPSTYELWRTHAQDMSNLPAAAHLEDQLLKWTLTIEQIYAGQVDLHLTDMDSYRIYNANQLQFLVTENKKIGDNNYDTLTFMRKPVLVDNSLTSGQWRLIGKDAIVYCTDPGFSFKWGDWIPSPNVPELDFKYIIHRFAMARKNAKHLACLYNIAA